MQMPARFPGPRNTRRLPDSGPMGAQLSNRTFSIGPWKLELERADYPGPKSLAAQARADRRLQAAPQVPAHGSG